MENGRSDSEITLEFLFYASADTVMSWLLVVASWAVSVLDTMVVSV